MARRGRHLRLPAQRLRVRGDAPRGAKRPALPIPSSSTPARSPPKPCARRGSRSARLRRENPDARIIVTGCAAQTEPESFADMAEVDRVLGNDEKLRGEAWRACAGFRARRQREVARQRHHGVTRDGAASGRRLSRACRAPSCRCRTAATIAAPSASFPTAAAIRARCRWARWSSRCGALVEQRLCRDRADRRRHHQLWRRPAGRAEARQLVEADPAAGAGAASACGSPRSIRSRPIATCSMPSPTKTRLMPHLHLSLQSGDDMILKRMKRRHLRARRDRASATQVRAAAAGHRRSAPTSSRAFRPRPKTMFARSLDLVEECGLTLPARLPLLAAPGHARRAHAAGRGRRDQGARGAAARGGRSGATTAAASGSGADARCADRERQPGRTEHYLPVAIAGETYRRVVPLRSPAVMASG